MYIGKIRSIADCEELGKESIAIIEEFLKNNDLKSLEVGKYQLDENNRVMIQEYTTKQQSGIYEAHRKYADVQVIVRGEEKFGVADNGTVLDAYDETSDFESFAGSGESFVLSPDGCADCAVFMPGELHAPGMCVEKPDFVRKAVFKILISK